MGNGQGLILRNVSTKNTRTFVASWRRQLVSWTTPLGMFKLKRILKIGSLDLRGVWWDGGQIWFLSTFQTGNVCDQTRSNVVKHFVLLDGDQTCLIPCGPLGETSTCFVTKRTFPLWRGLLGCVLLWWSGSATLVKANERRWWLRSR